MLLNFSGISVEFGIVNIFAVDTESVFQFMNLIFRVFPMFINDVTLLERIGVQKNVWGGPYKLGSLLSFLRDEEGGGIEKSLE